MRRLAGGVFGVTLTTLIPFWAVMGTHPKGHIVLWVLYGMLVASGVLFLAAWAWEHLRGRLSADASQQISIGGSVYGNLAGRDNITIYPPSADEALRHRQTQRLIQALKAGEALRVPLASPPIVIETEDGKFEGGLPAPQSPNDDAVYKWALETCLLMHECAPKHAAAFCGQPSLGSSTFLAEYWPKTRRDPRARLAYLDGWLGVLRKAL